MRFSVVSVLLASLLVGSGTARAGFTEPTLVLVTAAGAAAEGARSAAFTGSFEFENALQVGLPIELVVFQGTRFVRYPATGAPKTGDSAALADGVLSDNELAAFRQEGTAAPAGVRIITLAPDRIRVALPATFTAGPTTAVLFTILDDGGVLSNALGFTLP